MDRMTLSTAEQDLIAAKRVELGVQPGDPILDGTNLVQDDNLRINDTYNVWVVCGENGVVGAYIPDWSMYLAIDFGDDITDRAGPNGQTMPIYDAVQLEAHVAAKAAKNPKQAARDEHARRREMIAELRAAIQRLPTHKEQQHAREVLRAHGIFGKDD